MFLFPEGADFIMYNSPLDITTENLRLRISTALQLAFDYGQIDGDHHKTWLIDQIVIALTGSNHEYVDFLEKHNTGKDGPNTYEWNQGVAP